MTTEINPKEIWIGLIEVRPLEGSEILDDAKGAFINVVMWANSIDDYTRKSESAAAEMKLFVVDVTMPEPVIARRKREGDFEEQIEDMVSRSSDNPGEIVFGTFHLYEKDDG
ncbi:MAG: hypothetical protein ACXWBH_07135 [Candidatus Angelobacter sp.]